MDENGHVRKRCKIIPKGEVYERRIFTTKDERFKDERFLDEVKKSYTKLINLYVLDAVVKQPERPRMSVGAANYPRLQGIYDELNKRNWEIHTEQRQLNLLELSLSELKGVFKAKERKEVQAQIEESEEKITNMTESLQHIVRGYGYKTVQDFMAEYNAARSENSVYEKELAEWKRKYGPKEELSGNDLIERMMEEWYREHKQEKEEDRYIRRYRDRGAR